MIRNIFFVLGLDKYKPSTNSINQRTKTCPLLSKSLTSVICVPLSSKREAMLCLMNGKKSATVMPTRAI